MVPPPLVFRCCRLFMSEAAPASCIPQRHLPPETFRVRCPMGATQPSRHEKSTIPDDIPLQIFMLNQLKRSAQTMGTTQPKSSGARSCCSAVSASYSSSVTGPVLNTGFSERIAGAAAPA